MVKQLHSAVARVNPCPFMGTGIIFPHFKRIIHNLLRVKSWFFDGAGEIRGSAR